MPEEFYDQLVADYEQMTDESARLSREIPFLLEEIKRIGGSEILDVGCGTGGHARALGEHGMNVIGIDPSRAMIDKARANPHPENVRFEHTTLSDFAGRGVMRFEAILCLGNTLPHLVTEDASLAKVSRMLAPLVRRGGLLIGQIVNVPWIEASGVRLLPIRSWGEPGRETILTRHYINSGSSLLMIVTRLFRRPNEPAWRASTLQQRLIKIVPMELERAFDSGPWANYQAFGGWEKEPLDVNCPSVVFITTRR
jgi:SAM-dependent methyltransferase